MLQSTSRYSTYSMVAAAIGSLWLAPATAQANISVEIKEWQVPWEQSRPRDPWAMPDGTVWFVGQRSHYAAIFDPQAQQFTKIDLPEGAGPHTVIADERGAWYAGNLKAHIGLINPDTYAITQYAPPGDGRRDVHTMDFNSDGHIWFTEQGGNRIGLFNPDSEQFTMYDVPTQYARPYGLVVHNDQPWATLFGTHKLATVSDGELVEIELPRESARPRRLAVTADGMVWYVDYADGYLGRYNPNDEEVSEWRAPSAKDSRPYGMAADSEGRLWFVETSVQPNRLVGFDPASNAYVANVEIPSGGGSIRHMYYDANTNSIWFGSDANTVGQAILTDSE